VPGIGAAPRTLLLLPVNGINALKNGHELNFGIKPSGSASFHDI